MWANLLAAAFGGALGSVGRVLLNGAIERRFGDAFPLGILGVNALGCLAIGICAALFSHGVPHGAAWRSFLAVGVLGGFTTFSTFSLQTVTLFETGAVTSALLYVALSVALCLAATTLGLVATRAILGGAS
jgi:CrcB protein